MAPKYPCLLVLLILYNPFHLSMGRNSDLFLPNRLCLRWWHIISVIVLVNVVTHPVRILSLSLAGLDKASNCTVSCSIERPYVKKLRWGKLLANSQPKTEALSPVEHRKWILPAMEYAWKWILPQSKLEIKLQPKLIPWLQPCETQKQRDKLSDTQTPNPQKRG